MALIPRSLPHCLTLAALLAGCAELDLETDDLPLDEEAIGESEQALSDGETLDTDFSGDGKTSDFVDLTRGALAVVENPWSGDTFAVGDTLSSSGQRLYVRRLDSDGDYHGNAAIAIPGWKHALARDAVRQAPKSIFWGADDLIVAGAVSDGFCRAEGDNNRICGKYPMVARINNLGLDPGFSGDGVRTFAVGSYPLQEADAVTAYPAPDRRLAIAGRVCSFPNATTVLCKVFAARMLETGGFDTTFGGDGMTLAPVPAGYDSEVPVDVAVQGGGHLIVITHLLNKYGEVKATGIRRFITNGVIDPAWGNPLPGIDPPEVPGIIIDPGVRSTSVAVAPDGTIVVAGSTRWDTLPVGYEMTASRYTPTGEGLYREVVKFYDARPTMAEDVAVDDQGRVVLAGWVNTTTGRHIAVARLTEDGLDPSFGADGKIMTSFDWNDSLTTSVARSVAVFRRDGHLRILVAGGLKLWDDVYPPGKSLPENTYPDDTYRRSTFWVFARYLAD